MAEADMIWARLEAFLTFLRRHCRILGGEVTLC